ncbi:hypothetical protein [Actinoplanes sp. GCM10030250]|uniref:hypothetical protein n=1 Tax=Actinoplanes sp. GCM10030250 TaxID=3273376 RepID=UPI003617141B
MPRFSRPALLLASASMAVGVLTVPNAAYAADTTTILSATQMAAALKEVSTATATAVKTGWGGTMKVSLNGAPGEAEFAVDPASGRAFFEFDIDRETGAGYAVEHKGSYDALYSRAEFTAVKMMGRPTAKFVFTTNTKLDLDAWVEDNEPQPAMMLNDDTRHTGTKTVHDDGSSTYEFENPTNAANTFEVSASGVLEGLSVSYPPLLSQTLQYEYGPQTVTLPSAEQTVSRAALTKALAYVDMPAAVKGVAGRSATAVKKAAKGGTVKVASLRKIAKSTTAAHNSASKVKVIAVTDITGGVRLTAKNPYTGQKVSYTIKASGKKVVVKKA